MASQSSAADFAAEAARIAEGASRLLGYTLQGGGAYADLFFEHTVQHTLGLRQVAAHGNIGAPVRSGKAQIVKGAGLRLLKESRVCYGSTEHLSRKSLQALGEAVRCQTPDEGTGVAAIPVTGRPLHLQVPPDAADGIATSEKTALLDVAADAAFSLDERIRRVSVNYHDRVRRILVVTSEGVLTTSVSMLQGLRVEVLMVDGDQNINAYAVAGGTGGFGCFFDHPPEQAARDAVRRASVLAEAQQIGGGVMPVVIAAGGGGAWLHETAGHFLEADAAAPGRHIGQRIAPSFVNLVDDATLPGGRGSMTFDDEGMPGQRTALVEEGMLCGLITDRYHADRMQLSRTGNARRQDYRYPPLPRMSNLLMLSGTAHPDDLVADVKEGLYVRIAGDGVAKPEEDWFSVKVLEGRRIEQGKITTPVSGVCLSGSGLQALAGIAGVGSDLCLETTRGLCEKAGQVAPVSIGTPTVLIPEMQVLPCA